VEKIVVGGGIFERDVVLKKIHGNVKEMINGYVKIENYEDFIVKSQHKSNSGIIGALELSYIAHQKKF
jgi:hypothetical protein